MVPYFIIRPITMYFFEYGLHVEPPSFEVMRAVVLFPLTCLVFFYFGYFYSKKNENYLDSRLNYKPNKLYFVALYAILLIFSVIILDQLLSYFDQDIYKSREVRGSGIYITQAWVMLTAFFQIFLMSSFWISIKYNVTY